MASTYTTDLKIELMVTGENAGTWGTNTNGNFKVIEQAIAGYGEQSIAGGAQTTALTIANSPTLSLARNIVIKLTGTITGNQIVTVPDGIEKTWIVSNGTVGAFTVEFKTVSGTGTTWSTTDKGIKILYSDGTNINTSDLSNLSGQIAAAQITNSTITQAKLASNSVGTAQLQTNAVTAVKITQSTITQSKLAANSVGANQLISTGVTAASYTAATITVDADGRITSASSGSAGAGMGIPKLLTQSPGTFTAAPTTNRLGVYMVGGSGGGGNSMSSYGRASGGTGGKGGVGFFSAPIVQPFSQPFSIGTGGAAGPSSTAGNATTFTNVGTANGGARGNNGNPGPTPGNTGAAGTAPGAALTYPVYPFQVGGPNNLFNGGTGASPGFGAATGGNPGIIAVFENDGT
jgi:hypothetical protein